MRRADVEVDGMDWRLCERRKTKSACDAVVTEAEVAAWLFTDAIQ